MFTALALTTLLGYLDAPLVPGARPLEEPGRFESPRNFDDTIDFYQRHFGSAGGVRWHSIINRPRTKAKHIESLRKRSEWSGINVYEHDGHVRIFVLARKSLAVQ